MVKTPRSRESFSQAGVLRRELIDDRLLDELLVSASERGIALTGGWVVSRAGQGGTGYAGYRLS